ncbi:hypothetical protein ACQEVG_08765 [Streptomyces sp. CA-135486]|uniref:hypothetical protein n=1 Tax=Streptomyces sp. CA-135486 TaxID=3240049 RepID=UPI003D900B49
MIKRHFPIVAAVAVPLLLATACSGGTSDKKPKSSPHPVFSKPLDAQPYGAVSRTRGAGSASFTQTMTYASKKGDAVLTTTGRLDFTGVRGDGTRAWTMPKGFPAAAQDTMLGTTLGDSRGHPTARLAVDATYTRYRSGRSAYWLRYAQGAAEPYRMGDSITSLRGVEAPIGGTLLDSLSMVQGVKASNAADGGRSYTGSLSPDEAGRLLFPDDIRDELRYGLDAPSGVGTPLPFTLTVDSKGRITHATADLSRLLKGKNSALGGVTAIRSELTLTGYGASKPVLPASSEPILDAGKTVKYIHQTKPGQCIDFNTGIASERLVAVVPCTNPHDARIYASARLGSGGAYPGKEAAHRQVSDKCDRAYQQAPDAWIGESVEPGHFWSTWPVEANWDDADLRVATCYVLARRSA